MTLFFKGDESLAVSITAVPFASIAVGAAKAVVLVEDQPVRVRYGVDPTAAVGRLYLAGDQFIVDDPVGSDVRLIRSGATDAAVWITYFGSA